MTSPDAIAQHPRSTLRRPMPRSGALVVGDTIEGWRDLDWSGQVPRIELDGQALAGGVAAPPLGDHFHCLPWWLDHVGGARAGDIVTTGAWSGMHEAGPAAHLAVAFAGLGRVEARIGPR
jgi:2-keto-4-pentenoate hydratase